MTNPYRYGAPVSGSQFTGRHAELRAVADRMRNGINILVLSPRRYGKTSLIEKAAGRVSREVRPSFASTLSASPTRPSSPWHCSARCTGSRAAGGILPGRPCPSS